ncbi:MAG TPA: Clp protease N-terminal domain-containing protein [Pseudonocardiaceae bacterium]|jgi:ATP-dependent Clp protease ATP-binding subunit ClpC|nr:Clp protease N-terminal domain-containing protein [Pseudonocardiaceae bacterium]
MFERFTDQARRVLVHAQEEARELHYREIGDELLLVGIAAQQDDVATRVLAEAGASLDQVRERIPTVHRDPKKPHLGHIAFNPAAKKVLEGALYESTLTDSPHVGVKHLLIALIKLDGAGANLLRELGVNVDDLRSRVASAKGDTGMIEETQATPWSTPKADVETQLAGIESTLQQILTRLAAIEKRLPEQ